MLLYVRNLTRYTNTANC